MTEWGRLELRSDEELADELIAASLPELGAHRDLLVEVLRGRFEEVATRAFKQAGGAAGTEREFADWFWTYRRLLACLCAYRRPGVAAGLEPWLFNQARWRARDFFRERNRRRRTAVPLGDADPEDPGSGRELAEVEESEDRSRTLERARGCVEGLRPTLRLPYKLVHIYALELSDEDWDALAKQRGRARTELEAELEPLRAEERRLELAEVAALTRQKLHTIGTYVARAAKAIVECVRRRERRGARA